MGLPNLGKSNYKLFFNKFLIQTANADWFVPFSDGVKGWDFDPNLQFNEGRILFNLPPEFMPNWKSIKIKFEI